jgi:SAM-dependent methyltransferase
MNESNKLNLPCLLCDSENISVRSSLVAGDILQCWKVEGCHFTPGAIQSLNDEKIVHLYECRNCGFQFFNPKLAGGAEFYEQIHAQQSGYYAPDRSENKRNTNFAVQSGYHNILDVGCGSGRALDEAKKAGLETYGIELSRSAAASATERGHMIFSVLLDEMDPVWEGKFDLISLNQVLEHVPNPVELVKQCIKFLSPHGAIAIAVPNATGFLRLNPWLPANWPPHHISRWRIKDFKTVADRAGLRVIKTGGDRLLGAALQDNLLSHQQFSRALAIPYKGFPVSLIKPFCLFYRKSGLKDVFHSQGHSIYCYLKK